MLVNNVPLWSVTIWDKKYNAVEKEWQPKTIKYKYLLSDELDRMRVDGGSIRLLYTGKDIGYTTETLAGDALAEGEIVAIPWGGTPSVKYFNGKFVTGDNRIATSSKPEELLNKYLYYYLLGNLEEISTYYRGAGLKHPSMRDILNMRISYPSVNRQKQIITQFDLLQNIIDKRKQQLFELDTLVKARFVELTEMAPTTPTRMGDIATYLNGYAFKPDQWEDKGLPIIRIQNLNNPDAAYNYYSGELAEKYLVHSGDVLVSWATHLEAYVWKGESAWLNQHIFKVVFDKMDVDKIYFVFATEEALRQAFKNAHGFKPTMEHIKKADFDNAVVKLPPLPVQREFSRFAQQVDKSKVAVQKALDEAQTLFDSLMQQYFG